ncbi:MAG: hypothetical protein KH366_05715 [Clostridiaceae bacterium]|nr:hypothetical protein [Clostridiaceae bacterium]
MKKLDQKAYCEVKNWMHRNARALELAVWQYHFEDGSREKIVEELAYYQNEDGGFGNVLEADCWNPESTPYTTLIAIGILRDIGAFDPADPMVQGIFRYLENCRYCSFQGWFFSIPSNDQCPRAPWWTYDEEANALHGTGITASLAGTILHYADRDSELFKKAAGYAKQLLDKVKTTEDLGEMGAGGIFMLVGDIEQSGLSSQFDCTAAKQRLPELVNQAIERDVNKWSGYCMRPSECIPSPHAPAYKGNEEIVEKELDYLIETRNPGGVWNITWSWFDLGERYGREFAISENWWKASKAIDKMRFLRNFGRLS